MIIPDLLSTVIHRLKKLARNDTLSTHLNHMCSMVNARSGLNPLTVKLFNLGQTGGLQFYEILLLNV